MKFARNVVSAIDLSGGGFKSCDLIMFHDLEELPPLPGSKKGLLTSHLKTISVDGH